MTYMTYMTYTPLRRHADTCGKRVKKPETRSGAIAGARR